MQYFVMAVRDRAADVFGVPHYAASIGTAVRNFSDEVNRSAPDNMFNKHPEDFDLFHLGLYDDSTAKFETFEKPRQVAIGKDLVK